MTPGSMPPADGSLRPTLTPPSPSPELYAVVSHKGRSSDSGHYMGWVRRESGKPGWLVFDDDEVSETTSEYVASHLKGGGDDHMAVMLFYRAKA